MNKELLNVSKIKIENRINEILDEEIKKHISNDFIKRSLEELKRLSQGGKRVRGYLVKLGQLLMNKDDDSYIDIAAALEIFQTAILIHDDIIDEADLRRNEITINAKYPNHLGISKGICIGDLGFFLSYKILAESKLHSEVKEAIMDVYATTLYNTVVGEIIDVELPLESLDYHLTMEDKIIYDIYVNKTSWYTIIGPILIGALSAGLDKNNKGDLIKIGTKLGIAFQIKDDLLGLYSENNVMGKTLNDIKENKQTIIYKYAINKASIEELDIINKLYGKDINAEETKTILELFDKLGAKKNAEKLIEKYTNEAIEMIEDLDVSNKKLFIEFANYLLNRNN